MQNKRAFFKEAVKNLKSSGTVAPSSKYLIKKMLADIDFSKKNIIVEYGPGNGRLTSEILKKLSKDSLLICFEINDEFYSYLSQIKDERIVILKKSAENIENELNNLNINYIDYIISSLPLTNIPKKIAKKILKKSNEFLKKGGLFIQYQYSLTYYKKLKKVFNNNLELDFELRNIPPAFIYRCKK